MKIARYGRLPETVLFDSNLSDGAVRVYAILAMHVFEGSVARIGMRWIAQQVGCGSTTVHRRLKELVDGGHVIQQAGANGERSWYILTSAIFAQKQGRLDVIRSSPRGTRLVSVAEADLRK